MKMIERIMVYMKTNPVCFAIIWWPNRIETVDSKMTILWICCLC